MIDALGRAWRAVFRQGNLRLWAIILGAPPLCGGAVWLVDIIRNGWPADRAEQQLGILGNALYGVLSLVATIVVALATVKVRATTPAGSLAIGGADEPEAVPVKVVNPPDKPVPVADEPDPLADAERPPWEREQ